MVGPAQAAEPDQDLQPCGERATALSILRESALAWSIARAPVFLACRSFTSPRAHRSTAGIAVVWRPAGSLLATWRSGCSSRAAAFPSAVSASEAPQSGCCRLEALRSGCLRSVASDWVSCQWAELRSHGTPQSVDL